jgi:hypothetical protein
MADSNARPSFTEAWLADIQEDVKRYGKRKLVPWTALACIVIGAGVAMLVAPDHFWNHPEVSVVFFTATVTVNGLLLALSWGCFAKIYEIASEPRLASFLRRHDLLNSYIFHVDFIHYVQVAAVTWSAIALVLSVVHLPDFAAEYVSLLTLQRIALAGCVAVSIYALIYALGAVRIMQDLVWNSAHMPSEPDIKVHEGGRSTN